MGCREEIEAASYWPHVRRGRARVLPRDGSPQDHSFVRHFARKRERAKTRKRPESTADKHGADALSSASFRVFALLRFRASPCRRTKWPCGSPCLRGETLCRKGRAAPKGK